MESGVVGSLFGCVVVPTYIFLYVGWGIGISMVGGGWGVGSWLLHFYLSELIGSWPLCLYLSKSIIIYIFLITT